MPAIRSITEGRTTSPFFDQTFSSISAKTRYAPYNANVVASSTASWGTKFVDPMHLFVVPPPTMVVPSQAAALVDIPVGEYLTGISLDSHYYPETGAAKTTPKVVKSSKSRKGKAKSKENVAQDAEPKKTLRSKRRDPNYIPRPKNAFMIFRCELYQQTVQDAASATTVASSSSEPTASSSSSKPAKISQNEFSKHAASEWHSLSLEERKIFEDKAAEDKKRIKLLHLEKQKEAERIQREFDLHPVLQPEEYEVMNEESPLQPDQQTFTTSTTQNVKVIEIIDLTQDDDDEICDYTASSSVQVFKSFSWSINGASDDFGVDLSPRPYSGSPQLDNFSPSPVISSSEIDFSPSSQLHMPIPSIPIPSSISKFGYAAAEYQNASSFEDFNQAQTYTYASSSSPSSSIYSVASNLPALDTDTDAPSPASEIRPITPTSDSESIAKQLFAIMDLDLIDNQLPATSQAGFEDWMPLEALCGDSNVEFSVPDLNVDQWW